MQTFKVTYSDGSSENIPAASFDPGTSSFGITFYGPSLTPDDDQPAIAFRANIVVAPHVTGTEQSSKTIAAIDIVA